MSKCAERNKTGIRRRCLFMDMRQHMENGEMDSIKVEWFIFWARLQFASTLTALRLPRSTQTRKPFTPEYKHTRPDLSNKRNIRKIKSIFSRESSTPCFPFHHSPMFNLRALPQVPLLLPSPTHLLLPTPTPLGALQSPPCANPQLTAHPGCVHPHLLPLA